VVGSTNSSNSNRLRELAEKQGIPAYLIDGAEDIQRDWLREGARVALTAGASAPELLVEQVISRLQDWGAGEVQEQSGVREQVVFALPKELLPTATVADGETRARVGTDTRAAAGADIPVEASAGAPAAADVEQSNA